MKIMDKKEKITELIIKIKNYDKNALAALIELTQVDLIKTAYVYLKDKMLAEDIVNDTYITLIEKCHNLKNYNNLQGWLKTIVINKSIDKIKKNKAELVMDENLIDLSRANNNFSDEQINNIIVKECFLKLDENERCALLLHSYNYRLREIADEMNLTIKKVRTLLANAKKKFKEYYGKLS